MHQYAVALKGASPSQAEVGREAGQLAHVTAAQTPPGSCITTRSADERKGLRSAMA